MDSGTDSVLLSLKRMRYCGEVARSMGISMRVTDLRIPLLLELGLTT